MRFASRTQQEHNTIIKLTFHIREDDVADHRFPLS